jgi:micrococcal nuclease
VTRVVDGDPVILEGIGRARLIGVDTPETVHPQKQVEFIGKEASEFTRSCLEGRRVRVEYDWQRQDRHGRALVP